MVVSSNGKGPRMARATQKRKSRFRKAPQAPKRFKSAYIFFSTDTMQRIKNEQKRKGSNRQKITDISKRISHEWKALPAEERKKWELIAKTDKERFIAEKKNYKGPWQLPIKSGSQDSESLQLEEPSDASLLSESDTVISNFSQHDGIRNRNFYKGKIHHNQPPTLPLQGNDTKRLTNVSQEERDAAHNLVSLFQQRSKPRDDMDSFSTSHQEDLSIPERPNPNYEFQDIQGRHMHYKPLYRNDYSSGNYANHNGVYTHYNVPNAPRHSPPQGYGFY
uniref:HMG box domain-containing protein n=1 Tax=Chaetoceros debilis TaxID=122233 RepID=A0A7S3VGD8_9STRA|mmetsp:Transcript_9350/g.13978  ORF Transcript_9350/g.13978 Transcript_9350/m.13978 type:complete len:277 (+) Transcript_9350:138-968(+)